MEDSLTTVTSDISDDSKQASGIENSAFETTSQNGSESTKSHDSESNLIGGSEDSSDAATASPSPPQSPAMNWAKEKGDCSFEREDHEKSGFYESNLTIPEKDVKDSFTQPYNELLVPVNQSKKGLRSGKLYITKEVGEEKSCCRKYFCWVLLGILLLSGIILGILAIAGVFDSGPVTSEQLTGDKPQIELGNNALDFPDPAEPREVSDNKIDSVTKEAESFNALNNDDGDLNAELGLQRSGVEKELERLQNSGFPVVDEVSNADEMLPMSDEMEPKPEPEPQPEPEPEPEPSKAAETPLPVETIASGLPVDAENDVKENANVFAEASATPEPLPVVRLAGEKVEDGEIVVALPPATESSIEVNLGQILQTPGPHVPDVLDVEFKIENLIFNSAFENEATPEYRSLATELESELRKILNLTESTTHDFRLSVMQFKSGSVICHFRLGWMLLPGVIAAPAPFMPENLRDMLAANLIANNGQLSNYVVPVDTILIYRVTDLCAPEPNFCELLTCGFSLDLLSFTCQCPPGYILSEDASFCNPLPDDLPWTPFAEQVPPAVENSTHTDDRHFEDVFLVPTNSSEPTSVQIENGFVPIVSERDDGLQETEKGILDAVKAEDEVTVDNNNQTTVDFGVEPRVPANVNKTSADSNPDIVDLGNELRVLSSDKPEANQTKEAADGVDIVTQSVTGESAAEDGSSDKDDAGIVAEVAVDSERNEATLEEKTLGISSPIVEPSDDENISVSDAELEVATDPTIREQPEEKMTKVLPEQERVEGGKDVSPPTSINDELQEIDNKKLVPSDGDEVLIVTDELLSGEAGQLAGLEEFIGELEGEVTEEVAALGKNVTVLSITINETTTVKSEITTASAVAKSVDVVPSPAEAASSSVVKPVEEASTVTNADKTAPTMLSSNSSANPADIVSTASETASTPALKTPEEATTAKSASTTTSIIVSSNTTTSPTVVEVDSRPAVKLLEEATPSVASSNTSANPATAETTSITAVKSLEEPTTIKNNVAAGEAKTNVTATPANTALTSDKSSTVAPETVIGEEIEYVEYDEPVENPNSLGLEPMSPEPANETAIVVDTLDDATFFRRTIEEAAADQVLPTTDKPSIEFLSEPCGNWPLNLESSVFSSRLGASLVQWPSLVRLFFVQGRKSCTATVVDKEWVIAAYSCIKRSDNETDPTKWVIFAGGPAGRARAITSNTQIRTVEEIFAHPDAALGIDGGNMALVKLSKPFSFSDSLRAICVTNHAAETRQACSAAGWQQGVGRGDVTFSQYSKFITSTRVGLGKCGTLEDSENVICSEIAEEDNSCLADDGAPMMCVGRGGFWELGGTFSKSASCSVEKSNLIFSAVSGRSSFQWIKETIRR